MLKPVSISSGGGTLEFGNGIKLRLDVSGLGLPPVQAQFFDGAGDGTTWRGTRVLSRTVDLPVKLYAGDEATLQGVLSTFSRILAPTAGLVRITVSSNGVLWWIEGTRHGGGGDWKYGKTTDGRTILMTTITFKTEDPYWTRLDEESVEFEPGNISVGLLGSMGSMVGMTLSDSTALGTVLFDNQGDVEAYPVWKVTAPFDGFTLLSPSQELLEYTGTKATGYVIVDTQVGTIEDETGDNLYDGLNDVPIFWPIPSGSSVGTVEADGPSTGTSITCSYHPRKWAML